MPTGSGANCVSGFVGDVAMYGLHFAITGISCWVKRPVRKVDAFSLFWRGGLIFERDSVNAVARDWRGRKRWF